jgi:acyl-coenzyme A synthetase/AMP-(fatty) acid ligase
MANAEPLEAQARRALDGPPAAPAIEFDGHWHDWREVKAVADAVAGLLLEAGVGDRGPVAFVPRNRPEAIAAELGMIAARQTIRMVYAFQSATGIARDVARSGAAAVVAMRQDYSRELLEVVRSQGLAAIALDETMSARCVDGAERCGLVCADVPGEPEISVHTSGTTGPPKLVSFSFDTISRYVVGQNMIALGSDDRMPPVPLYFPLGNISGIYSVIPPMLHRMRVVLFDRFTLDGWLDYVRRFRPVTPGLPPAAVRMLLDRDLPKEALEPIRMLMAGAAPLDPTVQRTFEEKYGIPILVSYGATEFGGPVAAMMPADRERFGMDKIGSVGRPYAGARFRVIDPETEREVPAGEDGLLEVIAPRMGDEWIRTTDIGMVDEDGFLFLRGRADGAIVRGGFKLLPKTIERALCLHPAVAGAIVVGLPDERLGQVPGAVISAKAGLERPRISELEEHLRQHVYSTHIPTAWRFVETLPLNTSAKPDLSRARQLFESG